MWKKVWEWFLCAAGQHDEGEWYTWGRYRMQVCPRCDTVLESKKKDAAEIFDRSKIRAHIDRRCGKDF